MNLTTKSLIYNVSGIYKKQRGKQKLTLEPGSCNFW